MTAIGLCTHFSETDDWAFEYALNLAKANNFQLNICHWLESPYKFRRDYVYADLFDHGRPAPLTPKILTLLELRFREHFEPKLGDFTDVAFKLCEGAYQVELVRCFRQHLLDWVVMGYQPPSTENLGDDEITQPMEAFAADIAFPIIIVGKDGAGTYLLNEAAHTIIDQLALPADSWTVLDKIPA